MRMKAKQLQLQLAALKIAYEEAVLQKAAPEEIKQILQRIEEVNKKIAIVTGDLLH